MRIVVPQRYDTITDPAPVNDPTIEKIASEVMAAWMRLINRNVSFENRSSAIDITTQGNMFINAIAPITITLRTDAIEDESVTVYRNTTAGNVTVTDGIGTDILILDQTVISYRFKQSGGWIRGA